MDTPARLLLWIDGVGGYLVCTRPRVTLGQPGGETPPDLAILADVSRHHATIQRDTEGYFLEAIRKTTLNGQPAEKAFLRSGDRLTLGSACQLVFTQPVPFSVSARLDLVSGQRWQQPVAGALLMAETLVLGPAPQAHVVVDDLKSPMILFRVKQGLAVRHEKGFTVSGQPYRDGTPLKPGDKLQADGLSFAVEGVGA